MVLSSLIAVKGFSAEPSWDSVAVMAQVTVSYRLLISLIPAPSLCKQKGCKMRNSMLLYIHTGGPPACVLPLDHHMVYCGDLELARMSYAKLTSACLTGSVPLTKGHDTETLSVMTTTGKVPNL